MQTVKIDKARLVAALEENLVKHEADYAEGYENWQKAVLKELRKRTREFKKDPDNTDLYIDISSPQNHAHEYRETLGMLEWETEDKVTLTRSDYARYVNDDWPWKSQFDASNTMYAASAGR